MRSTFLIISFLTIVIGCKNSEANKEEFLKKIPIREEGLSSENDSIETQINLKKEKNNVLSTDINCLDESTENERVENFIRNLISNIENSNVKELSTKIKFPIDIFSHGEISNESVFIDKFSDSEAFEKFFGLEVFNENGELKDVSTFDNIQIFYTEMENVSSCYYVQFGLGTEIYNIQEINGVIKIVKFIGVG
ncbi:hypothetical protein [Aquimarina aggregata]|uniref:hypothetical protein n=1 Tax=Aquimarina aggregata TaxID=1642818 RepID=UPI00248FD4F0|nr:hypothetical protein [Aquimarina aggregata]